MLTDKLLATILCLTEELLNSRPLTPNYNDPSDMEALIPHRFLLARPSIAIPYLPDAQNYQNHRKMFRVAQAYMDNIWARWLKGYLPVHNIRQNWYTERRQLKEKICCGLSTIVKSVNGVKKCHFGTDGNIRPCDIVTQSGGVSRPKFKLSRALDDNGSVPPQEKHRASDEKACKPVPKVISNWVTLQSHNFDHHERINLKTAVFPLS